jgi:ATP-dependent Zn protease
MGEKLMGKANFQGNSKKPEMEVNEPPDRKFWLKQGPFSTWYFVVMMILFYFFYSAIQEKKEEIPYSQFQQYLAENQIAECVIREKSIIEKPQT